MDGRNAFPLPTTVFLKECPKSYGGWIGNPSTASNRWLCCHGGNYQNIEHQSYAEAYPGPHGGLRTFVGVLVVPHAPKHPSNDGEHEAEETEETVSEELTADDAADEIETEEDAAEEVPVDEESEE